MTLDPAIAAAFEPWAATPEERLAEAADLIRAKVPVEARLDPILPGVTDGAECLEPLCAALARIGVRRLSASVLFLRPAVAASLRRHVQDKVMLDRLLSSFAAGESLAIHAGKSLVRAIPACERHKIFERLKSIARRHGIEVRVCACKNPDIPATSCHVPVRWRHAVDRGIATCQRHQSLARDAKTDSVLQDELPRLKATYDIALDTARVRSMIKAPDTFLNEDPVRIYVREIFQ